MIFINQIQQSWWSVFLSVKLSYVFNFCYIYTYHISASHSNSIILYSIHPVIIFLSMFWELVRFLGSPLPWEVTFGDVHLKFIAYSRKKQYGKRAGTKRRIVKRARIGLILVTYDQTG